MVSSIVPGTAAGAGALGVDQRLTRQGAVTPQTQAEARAPDRVEVGGAASWAAARESVRAGLEQVHTALAIGHEAREMLVQAQALARGGGSQEELNALLKAYAERVEAAAARGASLALGDSAVVHAEPGAPPVIVAGADLRLKEDPAAHDVLALSRNARADDPTLPQAAQRSLDALQAAMERLFEAARALEAHQGFLNAAEGALAANADLDADGARLVALQVSQGLVSAGAIANVEPQSVLALFKA